MSVKPPEGFECARELRGVVALIHPQGEMRGPAATDYYLATINDALQEPSVRAIVVDLRDVTRLGTMRDVLRYARKASENPNGARVTRSAIVASQRLPLAAVLLRLVANGSRFFPERRVFLNDLEGALTWATAAPSRDDVPGRPA